MAKNAFDTLSFPLARNGPAQIYRSYGKRLFDLTLCALILPIALPLIALTWFIVRLDGGPGFFAHERIGQHGKSFICWKIRTMVPGAEARLSEILRADPAKAAEWAHMYKLDNDPRTTRIGRLLRLLSLDELPQIWNVLKGEMSLVGPRPMTHSEFSQHGSFKRGYLALRPGITGNWQVHARKGASRNQRFTLEAQYARNLTFVDDLSLLVQTIVVLMNPSGK